MKQNATVRLGRAARRSPSQDVRLARKAEAVAASLTLPDGVEFARFAHEGRDYALCVRLVVEVDALVSRVPDVVVRSSEARKAAAKAKEAAAEARRSRR